MPFPSPELLEAARAENPERDITGLHRPLQLPASVWQPTSAGAAVPLQQWQAVICSEGASEMAVLFYDFALPASATLKISAIGQQHSAEVWRDLGPIPGVPWLPAWVEGECAVLELILPRALALQPQNFPVDIRGVSHAFAFDAEGRMVPPGIEVERAYSGKAVDGLNFRDLCADYADYSTPSRGVVRYEVATGVPLRYLHSCTASLIDNGRQGQRANYLLTAGHCITELLSAPGDSLHLARIWWESAVPWTAELCRCAPGTVRQMVGLRLVAQDFESFDFALLRLEKAAPAKARAVFQPWSAQLPSQTTKVFNIHHARSYPQLLTLGRIVGHLSPPRASRCKAALGQQVRAGMRSAVPALYRHLCRFVQRPHRSRCFGQRIGSANTGGLRF